MAIRGPEHVALRVEPLDEGPRAVVAKRYERLGVLGRGATGTVYRARDRLHRRLVALKTSLPDVGPTGSDPLTSQPMRAVGLWREFELLAGLRHPNVVTCLEYGLDASRRAFFTMDIEHDALPLREAARPLPEAGKVDLLVQLLHALAYLHRRGFVHRDVKPDNVLVASGVVKLIDFGLTVAAGGRGEAGAGTVAYAAPEVIRGAPASAAADLFAVGVAAFEIFAGRHPFDVRSQATLLQSLFHSEPDWSAIEPRMRPVLARLLARDPRERFGGVLEVLAALEEAAGRRLPVETPSTREAFLQGTELVGREEDLERLRRAVPERGGSGAAVVVTGESGVGKSRVLDELAVDAMIRGARVLRGQALHTGGRPFEPWRAVLRALALIADPSPLEASVVAGVVPDVAGVLERAIPVAPELEPDATQHRLVRVLEALLRRSSEPLLLVLEDMQWAGAESLALFARVRALGATLPVSVVASFRTERGAADLPAELAAAEVLALAPLSVEPVARLCATTIGGGGESRERRLAEVVFAKSGGNPFAVLEAVRTLAHVAGGLERVRDLDSPERALADRVERLLDRRVERLSEMDRAVLRTAAVAGRELDLDLLAALHPAVNVAACAARAVEAAMLTSVQGRFWFAHDKIRDAIVEAMPDAQRRRAHLEVGDVLERLVPNDAATLAHHFRAAEDEARERKHVVRAGDQFLRSGAYREAIPHLRRALDLLERSASSAHERARIQRQLGEALFRCGRLPEAKESLGAALALLGRSLPSSKARLAQAMAAEAGTQLALRARRAPSPPADTEAFEEAVLAHTQLSRLAHHLNDEPLVLYVTLSALNLAERGGLAAHHARLAAVFGAVTGLLPVHAWARFYFALARDLGGRIDDPSLRAFVLAHQGYYEAGIGCWRECREHLEESIDLYQRIGDVRLAEESISILAYALFYKDERARSLELYGELERSGAERGDGQMVGWGTVNRLKLLVRMGQLDGVDDATLASSERLLVDGITEAVHAGVRVDLALARGDLAAVLRAADAAEAQLKKSPPRSFMACSTYASIAEARIAYASEGDREDRARLAGAARAVRRLASIARVFPIAEPSRLLCAGRLEALAGRTARARELLARAATVADEREQPFEAGRARAALANLDARGR